MLCWWVGAVILHRNTHCTGVFPFSHHTHMCGVYTHTHDMCVYMENSNRITGKCSKVNPWLHTHHLYNVLSILYMDHISWICENSKPPTRHPHIPSVYRCVLAVCIISTWLLASQTFSKHIHNVNVMAYYEIPYIVVGVRSCKCGATHNTHMHNV